MMASTPNPEPGKIRLYADQSVEHFNWLSEMGIAFNDGFYKRKISNNQQIAGLCANQSQLQ
jgi:hypothetical protein